MGVLGLSGRGKEDEEDLGLGWRLGGTFGGKGKNPYLQSSWGVGESWWRSSY